MIVVVDTIISNERVQGSKPMQAGRYKVHYRELAVPAFCTHATFLEWWQRYAIRLYRYIVGLTWRDV